MFRRSFLKAAVAFVVAPLAWIRGEPAASKPIYFEVRIPKEQLFAWQSEATMYRTNRQGSYAARWRAVGPPAPVEHEIWTGLIDPARKA